MRNVPSRVSPVYMIVRGSTGRRYQKRVTRMPRSVEAIISSMDVVPPDMRTLPLLPMGGLPCFCAQYRSYWRFFTTPFSIHVVFDNGCPSPENVLPYASGSSGSDVMVTRSSTTFVPILLPPPCFEKNERPSSAPRAFIAPMMNCTRLPTAV